VNVVALSYVFWSDWGMKPFIGRVGMDGSQLKHIVTTDIYWPNGVTVDYASDRLFWVDAMTNRLEYVSYFGPYNIKTFLAFFYSCHLLVRFFYFPNVLKHKTHIINAILLILR